MGSDSKINKKNIAITGTKDVIFSNPAIKKKHILRWWKSIFCEEKYFEIKYIPIIRNPKAGILGKKLAL